MEGIFHALAREISPCAWENAETSNYGYPEVGKGQVPLTLHQTLEWAWHIKEELGFVQLCSQAQPYSMEKPLLQAARPCVSVSWVDCH